MLSSWQSLKTCRWRVCVCVFVWLREREKQRAWHRTSVRTVVGGWIQWAVILMRAAKVLRCNQWPASRMFHSLCRRWSIPEYATGHSLLSCSIFVVFARCNLWPHPSCGSIISFLALSSKLQWIALNWTVWLRNLKIQHPPLLLVALFYPSDVIVVTTPFGVTLHLQNEWLWGDIFTVSFTKSICLDSACAFRLGSSFQSS